MAPDGTAETTVREEGGGGDPRDEIPTPAALAEWLRDCQEAAFVEATARLDAMTAGAAEWVWTVQRPLHGFPAALHRTARRGAPAPKLRAVECVGSPGPGRPEYFD